MVNRGNTLVASFFQDPRVDEGGVLDGSHPFNGEPSTYLGRQDIGGQDWALRYTGLLGTSLVLGAQGAIHHERNSVGPATAAGDTIQFIDTRNQDLQTGGFGLIQEKYFKRYLAGVSANAYLSNHDVKLGFEYMEDKADVIKRESGGQHRHDLRQPGRSGGAGLPALLLDDARRGAAGQRPDLRAEHGSVPSDVQPVPAGLVDGSAEPDRQRRGPLGHADRSTTSTASSRST